jgi:hypothetical protein
MYVMLITPRPPPPPPTQGYPSSTTYRGPACRLDLTVTLTATKGTAAALAAALRRTGLCKLYGGVCSAVQGKLLCAGEHRGGGGKGRCGAAV